MKVLSLAAVYLAFVPGVHARLLTDDAKICHYDAESGLASSITKPKTSVAGFLESNEFDFEMEDGVDAGCCMDECQANCGGARKLNGVGRGRVNFPNPNANTIAQQLALCCDQAPCNDEDTCVPVDVDPNAYGGYHPWAACECKDLPDQVPTGPGKNSACCDACNGGNSDFVCIPGPDGGGVPDFENCECKLKGSGNYRKLEEGDKKPRRNRKLCIEMECCAQLMGGPPQCVPEGMCKIIQSGFLFNN